jgi:hypothetical protein
MPNSISNVHVCTPHQADLHNDEEEGGKGHPLSLVRTLGSHDFVDLGFEVWIHRLSSVRMRTGKGHRVFLP